MTNQIPNRNEDYVSVTYLTRIPDEDTPIQIVVGIEGNYGLNGLMTRGDNKTIELMFMASDSSVHPRTDSLQKTVELNFSSPLSTEEIMGFLAEKLNGSSHIGMARRNEIWRSDDKVSGHVKYGICVMPYSLRHHHHDKDLNQPLSGEVENKLSLSEKIGKIGRINGDIRFHQWEWTSGYSWSR